MWNLAKAMRPTAIVVLVVAWNILCFIGLSLNDGTGRITTVPSALVMAFTCAALAVFAFSTAQRSSWQRVVLRDDADPKVARPGLLLLGFVATLLTIGGVINAYAILRRHS